jgi:hypothetical protein
MTQLDPSAKALLDAARNAAEPTAEDQAATQADLERHLGAAAFVLPAGAATSATVGTAKAVAGTKLVASAGAKTAIGSVLLAKPVVFAVGTVVTMGLAWSVVQANRPPSVAGSSPAPTYVPTYGLESNGPRAALTPAAPLATTEAMTAETAPAALAGPTEGTFVTRRVPAWVPPPPESSTKSPPAKGKLGDEAHLLQQVFGAMQHGQPQRALDLLDEHAARFPLGSMRAESSAERVLALCSIGRTDEARTEARRFFLDYPDAPLSERVRSSCAGTR